MKKHPLKMIPVEIKKQATFKFLIYVISSIIFKGLAFCLQIGKDQIIAGNIVIGLLLITAYYVSDILSAFFKLWEEDIHDNFQEAFTIFSNNRVANILFKVRGKVWTTNDKTGSSEIMPTNTLINSCNNYLFELWHLKTGLPMDIVNLLTFIITFIGFILVSSLEIEHIEIFLLVICISSTVSIIFTKKRVNQHRSFIDTRKKASQKQEVLLNDILNIEPLNRSHSKYMINNYIKAGKETFGTNRKERKALNRSNFFESLFSAIATISIIAIKLYEVGIENVNLEVVLSIISIMAIYSSVMDSIIHVVRNVEEFVNSLDDIKAYEEDFTKIIKVYDSETQQDDTDTVHVSEITIPEFAVQYPALNCETPFLLKNLAELTFKSDDIVLLVGPTGSGKSTLMKLVTNYMKFDSFELKFETTSKGHIGTVMHQTDGKLGCNDILSELTLGQDVDEEKLLHILKGVHLFEEISQKDSDVISYLRNSKLENYSTGQKQRLAIARLLYNLTDDIQIIGFDEATNALNDAITLQTLVFIKEYCKGKILFIATHQVDSGNTIATKTLEFVPSGTHYEIKPV